MVSFSTKIISFYASLQPSLRLPKGIELLWPQQDPQVMNFVRLFYEKYYSDNHPRTLLFGINPGRFGAGVTGINFTAPKQLTEYCDIPHPQSPRSELSAEFIYELIQQYGGPSAFYSRYFISAVCPLGFVKQGKNLNYYDDPALQKAVTPFILDCMEEQLRWIVNRHSCICIGGEKNYSFLMELNERHQWFKEIIPVPHPRFIMQYRRTKKADYINEYLQALNQASGTG